MSYDDNLADNDEDDYGGYFLRPVNEYKIAEKIILANKELFGERASASTEATSLDTIPTGDFPDYDETTSAALDVKSVINGRRSYSVESDRRVTFRQDLEDYEPDFITDNEDDDDQQTDDSVSESDDELVNSVRLNDNCSLSNNNINSHDNNDILNSQNMDYVGESSKDVKPTCVTTNPMTEYNDSEDECAEEIEEICEAIEDFDISERPEENRHTMKHKAMSHHHETENEDKASVITTLSISDSENSQITPVSCEVLDNDTNAIKANIGTSQIGVKKSSSAQLCKNTRQSSTSILSSGRQQSSSAGCSTNRNHSTMLKIQLNFKPCCEYKYLETSRLPRYCGYFSQYGLSKEQLDRREARREKYHSRKSKRIERKAEEESNKSRINEEAFENWLRLKMRNSHSGTRNMYDVKPGKYRPNININNNHTNTNNNKHKRNV